MNDSRRRFDQPSHHGPRGFTATELEEATGFDRRTIAYYVQEGLLPRVGRRGPRTRYPRFVRDRLLFIRRVREAEEAGDLPPMSLDELRTAFARLPRQVVAAVADRAIAVSKEVFAGEAGARGAAGQVRSASQRRRALEDRLRSQRTPPDSDGPSRGPPDPMSERGVRYSRRPPSWAVSVDRGADARAAATLGAILAAVSNAARRREEASSQPVDTWMRAEVAPGVELSVRGATDEEMELLEQVAAVLRSLMSREEAEAERASEGDD